MYEPITEQELMKEPPQAVTSAPTEEVTPPDMLAMGNIDVNHRPVIKNDDGSVSTIFSATIPLDKSGNPWKGKYEAAPQYALVPTIADGKFLTADGKMPNSKDQKQMTALINAATAHYQKTREHLGIFRSGAGADTFAENTHDWMPTGGAEKIYLPLKTQYWKAGKK